MLSRNFLTVENYKLRGSIRKEIYYIRKFNPVLNEKYTLQSEQEHSRMPGHTKDAIAQSPEKH